MSCSRPRRLLLRALALGSLALFTSIPLSGRAFAAKAAFEIKIATLAPEGSTWMKIMTELDAEIRSQTQNAVGLKIYAGGIQGGEDVVLRKIRTGQLHGAGFTGVGLGEIAPSLRVMELPFLFQNGEEVQGVHSKMDPIFEQKLAEGGYTLLGWAEVGFIYLYSQDPISTPEQLKAAKVWLWEGDFLAETFLKTAGVSPVPLDVIDVMTSLQTGLVSAVYVSPLACIALQWFTRVKYVTDLPLTHGLGAVVITNEAWGKIPARHQATVRALCSKQFDRLREATAIDNAKSADVILQSGVEKVSLPPQQAQAFRSLGAQVEKALVGRLYDQTMLDQVHTELEAFRASQAKSPTGAVK